MKRGRSDLPKFPEKGEQLTVARRPERLSPRKIVEATVSSGPKKRGVFQVKWREDNFIYRYNVRRRDEGKTWARGHGTPAANALKTVATLLSET